MSLKEFQLTNFKAFSNPDPIPIRPITLIFGPNSSGKSSIIQALLLLKQTLQDENPNAVLSPKGNEVDLGSFYEFVHGHETERTVSFKISIELNKENEGLWMRDFLEPFDSLALKITFNYEQQIRCSSLELFIGDDLEPVVTFKLTTDSINRNHHFWRVLWDNYFSDFTDSVKTGAKQIKEKLVKELDSLRERNEKKSKNTPKEKPSIKRKMGGLTLYLTSDEGNINSISEELEALDRILERLNDYSFKSFVEDILKLKNSDFSKLEIKKFLPLKQLYNPAEDLGVLPHLIIWSDIKKDLEKYAVSWESGIDVLCDLVIKSETHVVSDDITELTYDGYIVSSFLPSDIAVYVGKVLSKELSKIVYISGLREPPERYYIHRGNKVEQVGKSGTLAADLLLQDKDVLERTNDFFKNLKYELKVSPLKSDDGEVQDVYAIRLVSMEMNTHANITDVGFGVSQVLPVVVQSAVSQNATLCIEQPELHLHPGAQRELGDLFIESALGERKNTFIIETHSEHIILRILRRIRETTNGNIEHRPEIRPQDVSVIYAKPSPTGTKLYPLEITKDGDFADRWPDGFFTERIEEIF
jgi:predicted ATPase